MKEKKKATRQLTKAETQSDIYEDSDGQGICKA